MVGKKTVFPFFCSNKKVAKSWTLVASIGRRARGNVGASHCFGEDPFGEPSRFRLCMHYQRCAVALLPPRTQVLLDLLQVALVILGIDVRPNMFRTPFLVTGCGSKSV